MKRIDKTTYLIAPNRYELRNGMTTDAPLCPFGNHYQWIGFDLESNEYVRFTKSVFKDLIREVEKSV